MYLRILLLVSALVSLPVSANELLALQSNTIAAQLALNPFVGSLVQQGLVECPAGGESAEDRAGFVGCMNTYVFNQLSRWGICAKRFPTLDGRVLQPCIDDQERAHQLAIASLKHVEPAKYNRCAALSLYEPSEEMISAFYAELGKQIIETQFKANAGSSFVLALGPFDAEKMLDCVAN